MNGCLAYAVISSMDRYSQFKNLSRRKNALGGGGESQKGDGEDIGDRGNKDQGFPSPESGRFLRNEVDFVIQRAEGSVLPVLVVLGFSRSVVSDPSPSYSFARGVGAMRRDSLRVWTGGRDESGGGTRKPAQMQHAVGSGDGKQRRVGSADNGNRAGLDLDHLNRLSRQNGLRRKSRLALDNLWSAQYTLAHILRCMPVGLWTEPMPARGSMYGLDMLENYDKLQQENSNSKDASGQSLREVKKSENKIKNRRTQLTTVPTNRIIKRRSCAFSER
ncbi:hypothetical protein DFH06DRAFT_1123896 [Mycena polygramma]|nr:hypothetical protein DFH06DRAFT_1123896 [Mycena polygramma]